MRFALKWCDFLILDVTFVKWRGHAVMWLGVMWLRAGARILFSGQHHHWCHRFKSFFFAVVPVLSRVTKLTHQLHLCHKSRGSTIAPAGRLQWRGPFASKVHRDFLATGGSQWLGVWCSSEQLSAKKAEATNQQGFQFAAGNSGWKWS